MEVKNNVIVLKSLADAIEHNLTARSSTDAARAA